MYIMFLAHGYFVCPFIFSWMNGKPLTSHLFESGLRMLADAIVVVLRDPTSPMNVLGKLSFLVRFGRELQSVLFGNILFILIYDFTL